MSKISMEVSLSRMETVEYNPEIIRYLNWRYGGEQRQGQMQPIQGMASNVNGQLMGN